MVFLAQTDTVAGFLSHVECELNTLKGREASQKCVLCVANCAIFAKFARPPKRFFVAVRRAKRTTFALKNGVALRVVKDIRHARFLCEKLDGWAFSTSANAHGARFDEEWAKSRADWVEEGVKFDDKKSSTILKVGLCRARKIR